MAHRKTGREPFDHAARGSVGHGVEGHLIAICTEGDMDVRRIATHDGVPAKTSTIFMTW